MQIELDAKELTLEVKRDMEMTPQLRVNLWAKLRAVSLETERAIKKSMPVDTGRARASWGNWSDAITQRGKATSSERKNAMEASEGDSVYVEDEPNLKVKQGSNLSYIEALNAGHSKQAPAGFLDVRAEQALQVLEQVIDEVLREN